MLLDVLPVATCSFVFFLLVERASYKLVLSSYELVLSSYDELDDLDELASFLVVALLVASEPLPPQQRLASSSCSRLASLLCVGSSFLISMEGSTILLGFTIVQSRRRCALLLPFLALFLTCSGAL